MNTPESVAAYEQYIEQTPQAISQTCQLQTGVATAQAVLKAAGRIFFTGSGSSVPAALLGSQLLAKYSAKAGIFAPSSLLLDGPNLTESDVVVLVSQGWNRADAVLTTRKVLQSDATLVVVTGRPEHAAEHGAADNPRVIVVPIFPVREKIFCRPATVVTGYLKIAELVAPLTDKLWSEQQWLAAYEAGREAAPADVSDDTHYVVLTSGLLLCAGNNVTLSLREGAGRHATLQEIESYGHGQYASDLLRRNDTRYLVLACKQDSHVTSAIARIKPLLDGTHVPYEVWQAPGDAVLANVTHMARIAQTVRQAIQRDNWDMNNPPGMEENRGFHEVDA